MLSTQTNAGLVGLAVHLRSLPEYSRKMSPSTPTSGFPLSPFSSSSLSFILSLAQLLLLLLLWASLSFLCLFYSFYNKEWASQASPPHSAAIHSWPQAYEFSGPPSCSPNGGFIKPQGNLDSPSPPLCAVSPSAQADGHSDLSLQEFLCLFPSVFCCI